MSAHAWDNLHELNAPGHAEAPTNDQAVGASTETHIETVATHPATDTSSESAQASTEANDRATTVRSPRRVNPNDGRFIRAVVAGTAVAGIVAFAISFAALYEVAAWLGLPWFMHWAVPVFIDLAILVYAGSVLVHEARGESSRASWWALGAFTGLSLVANAAHALSAHQDTVWQSIVGVTIAAMVPVAVFVATDQLARVAVENPESRRAEMKAEMDDELQMLRVRSELEMERDRLAAELEAKRLEVDRQRRDAARQAELAEAEHRRQLERVATAQDEAPAPQSADESPAPVPVQAAQSAGQDVEAWVREQIEGGQVPSAADIAERFGCSERTGRRKLAALREAEPALFGDEEEQA